MAKTKIDWQKAKTDYISSQQETYLSIAGRYNVSHQTVKDKALADNWTKARLDTLQIADKKTTEIVADKIAQVNARQAGLGVALQGMSIKAIQEKDADGNPVIKPKTTDDIRLLALTGVTIERKALNIEKKENLPVAVQINFGSPEIDDWAT
ncbi:MAG: hypothetical protein A2905_00440 [Candidatus Levybacteria bacterium RIFCSPLOWO2_01_FULL_36_10]|nr:MAG: hypothetical protein A2905_00440 [Candidatus Levybacteria bacterium RIFCSPLOWO2_01_FULL_36_10]